MGAKHKDSSSDPDGLGNRMGHEQDGKLGLLPKLQQFFLHLPACESVESGERLVHQKNARFHRQSAGDCRALFHSSGQRMRIAIGKLGQLHFLNIVHRAFFSLTPGRFSARGQGENNILLYRFPRKKLIEFLEHEYTIGSGRFHRQVVQ